MSKRTPKALTPEQMEEIRTKDFFDMILPGTVKFLSDHYIVGDSYRCAWVIREYPPSTEEQAILSQLADRNGVTLRIYHRLVELARRNSLKKKKQTGVKTELGKYSSKYALTELLICGKCGTAYRRSVWSKNGKKKAVWRCISRMEYGTKYCPDSPTIEESVIHRAVVEAIREAANDGGCQLAIKNLQTHIRMYYGGNDDNSLAADELRLNQLIAEVMNRAKQSDADSTEFLALSQEIAETKKRIAEKKAQQMTVHANEARMNEVLGTLDALKNHPIDYDDIVTRKLIDCIKVVSKNKLLVIFKGGIEKKVAME